MSLFGALLAALGQVAAPTGADPLDGALWRQRVLVVSRVGVAERDALALEAALDELACEVRERDLIVVWLREGDAGADGEPLSPARRRAMRERLGLDASQWHAALIGKDGGVKARYAGVPELADVFALIDGMPMRRAEARRRPSACADERVSPPPADGE